MFSELFAPVSIGVRTIAKTVRILERNHALIGKIMAINPLVVERTLEKWESLELLDISNGKTLIVPSLIDPIYQWITLKDKESGVVPYPPSIQTYLEKEQPHFQGS